MTEKLYKNRTAQGSADVNYRTKLRYYTYKFGFEMLSKPKLKNTTDHAQIQTHISRKYKLFTGQKQKLIRILEKSLTQKK